MESVSEAYASSMDRSSNGPVGYCTTTAWLDALRFPESTLHSLRRVGGIANSTLVCLHTSVSIRHIL